MSSFTSSLYSGSASIGQIKANVSVVIGGFMVIASLISASSSIMSKPTRTATIDATVVESRCKQTNSTNSEGKTVTLLECMTLVEYTVGNKLYVGELSTLSNSYNKGEKITIQYNPSNPQDISYKEISMRYVGFGLSSIAICMGVFLALYYYLIMRFKPLAAYEGASTSIGMAKGLADKLF